MCYEHVSKQGDELYELVSPKTETSVDSSLYSNSQNFFSDLSVFCTFANDLSNCFQVAHLPDKANNYLAPALSVLEKNTWLIKWSVTHQILCHSGSDYCPCVYDSSCKGFPFLIETVWSPLVPWWPSPAQKWRSCWQKKSMVLLLSHLCKTCRIFITIGHELGCV